MLNYTSTAYIKKREAVNKYKNMKTNQKNYFKYALGFLFCLLLRLIPFRAPNIETILAVQMPFARIYGNIASFSFGFFSIIVYDLLTSTFGAQTFIVSITYGFLGLWAVKYFQKIKDEENKSWNYIKFAFMSTIIFDIVTGLSVGPLFFHQSFLSALVGQIPFTILHLVGNMTFAYILSPAIYNFALKKKKSEMQNPINILNPQKI